MKLVILFIVVVSVAAAPSSDCHISKMQRAKFMRLGKTPSCENVEGSVVRKPANGLAIAPGELSLEGVNSDAAPSDQAAQPLPGETPEEFFKRQNQ
jgi:hypothetical protein